MVNLVVNLVVDLVVDLLATLEVSAVVEGLRFIRVSRPVSLSHPGVTRVLLGAANLHRAWCPPAPAAERFVLNLGFDRGCAR